MHLQDYEDEPDGTEFIFTPVMSQFTISFFICKNDGFFKLTDLLEFSVLIRKWPVVISYV